MKETFREKAMSRIFYMSSLSSLKITSILKLKNHTLIFLLGLERCQAGSYLVSGVMKCQGKTLSKLLVRNLAIPKTLNLHLPTLYG